MIDRESGRNWAVLSVSRVLNLLALAACLAIAGRHLDSGPLGLLFISQAIYALTSMLCLCGLMPTLLRSLAGKQGRTANEQLRSHVQRARRRGLWAGSLYVVGTVALFGDGDYLLFLPALLHPLLFMQLAAAPSLLHGRTLPIACSETTGRLAGLLLVLAVAAAGANSAGPYLVAMLMGPTLGSMLLPFFLNPHERRQLWQRSPTRDPARLFSPAQRTIALGDIARLSYLKGLHFVLRALSGSAYTVFAAAATLQSLGCIFPATLATCMQGPLSQGKHEEQQRRLLRSLPMLFACGLLASCFFALPAPQWIDLFFPRLSAVEQDLAARSLQTLALGFPAMFCAGVCLPFLLARGHERAVLKLSLAGLLFCLVLLPATHASFGILAAAISSTVTEWLVFFLALGAVVRTQREESSPTCIRELQT